MKHPDTQLLRAIAILIVVNSHLDRYYPVSYLATGGQSATPSSSSFLLLVSV